MSEFALTTIDNKANPITEYDEWRSYDTAPEIGYNTESLIARIANTSPDMSETEEESLIEWAMDEIIRIEEEFGLFGTHGKPMWHIKVDKNGKIL